MLITSRLYEKATGSIGNVTARPSRGGISLIDKITPKITTTTRKSKINKIISDAHKHWKTLTPAIRQDWNTYAETRPRTDILGNTNTISGLQEFIHSATNFEQNSGFDKPYKIRPPTEIGYSTNNLVELRESVTGTGIDFRMPQPSTDRALFFISNPQNITSNTYKGNWLYFFVLNGQLAAWQRLPYSNDRNKNYFYRTVFYTQSGRLSKPVIYKQHTAP